jgi:two-component system sensor histidine kinase YesM
MPDMDLSEYSVLPLLLQPVVENSIVHGLEKKGGDGKIWIAVYKMDGAVKIDISDNGGGMDPDTMRMVIHRVTNYERERHTSGIALYNINRRIKLNYGEAYGLKIDSTEGEGTMVSITLPEQKSNKQFHNNMTLNINE